MMNDPNSEQGKKPRRPHPLEQQDYHPERPQQPQQSGQVMLRMPVVKPYAVWVLIGINGLIYILVRFLMNDDTAFDFYANAWNNQTAVLADGEFYRMVTSMFLHSLELPVHIVFNMYALYAIGITVERFFGHARFLMVYFLGGIGGSLLSVLLNGPDVVSVGASGAVFAIFGAEMVFLYKHQKLFGRMAQVQLRQLIIIGGINLLFGFVSTLDPSGASIDNWGHIGGFIGGVIVAWIIGPVLIPQRHPTQPDALTIEDINPLEKNTQPMLAYISALMIVLLIGTVIV